MKDDRSISPASSTSSSATTKCSRISRTNLKINKTTPKTPRKTPVKKNRNVDNNLIITQTNNPMLNNTTSNPIETGNFGGGESF